MTPLSIPLATRRPPAPAGRLAAITALGWSGGDRETVPLATVQGTLALDLDRVPEAPQTPALRVVPGEDSAHHREVHDWAARFAQATVEVLGGMRPLPQLVRWTSPGVYADLERRVRILRRATSTPGRLRAVRPQVMSVHVCSPGHGVAEVSVHVKHGQRSRAVAARLEQRAGRWLCVALQLG